MIILVIWMVQRFCATSSSYVKEKNFLINFEICIMLSKQVYLIFIQLGVWYIKVPKI